ncbi:MULTISPECIES: CHAP domain-containing protein [unclassified Spirillospora]|uniref:CHAP domain-containing protein n=1 Tax=unclassified Spirillospora TaxID=2642701 RepID=UPI00371FF1E9
MTGRFDRLSLNNITATLNSFTAEDKAVSVAVSAVLAGAVGLAMFNPLTGDAVAETPAQAAAEKGTVSSSESAERSAADYLEAGYKVPPRAVKASEVLELAEEQVGISEGQGGQTKFHDWYVSTPHAKATAQRDGGFSVDAYNGAQWCNMFVSWLGAQTGVKNMGWDAYTVQHASWFEDTGRWGKKAKPGSVVFFDWDKSSSIGAIDHVGIVVKDNGDGTVSTIEGNTENAVQKKVRDKSTVVGYGYPDYAA